VVNGQTSAEIIDAVLGFAQGFLGSSSATSKKMLAPLKTRNMFRGEN
jgi:hypothetical protein